MITLRNRMRAANVSAEPGHSPTAAAAGRGPLRFAGLAYAITVLIIGSNLPTPLYAVYQRIFGISDLDITLLVAVYAAAVTVSLLLCGPLADAVGYRPVIAAGLVTAAAGSAVLAAAPGLGWLIAGRAVQGLAVGASSGTLTAALVASEPAGRTARASFFAATATTVAVGAGPVIAGALAEYGPDPAALPYLVEIGLLVPAVWAALALPARFGAGGQRWRPRRPTVPPAGLRAFAEPVTVGFLGWAVAYVVLALVPSYTAATLGSANLLVDGAAAGSLLVFAAAAQIIFRRCRPARAQWAGTGLLVAGLAGLAAAGPLASGPLLFGAIAVAGAGQGLGYSGALQRVGELAPAGARAGTISLFYVISYTGAGLATIGVGSLATAMPLTAAVEVFAAVFAVATGVTFVLLTPVRNR